MGSSRSARSYASSSHISMSGDVLGGIGSTNKWERVPSSFYGLSSVRARVDRMVSSFRGGGDDTTAKAFLKGGQARHGLAEFLRKSSEMNTVERLKAVHDLLAAGANPNQTVKVPWQPFRTTALFEGKHHALTHTIAHKHDRST